MTAPANAVNRLVALALFALAALMSMPVGAMAQNSATGAFLSYNPYGGAAPLPLYFNINGINYQFPFTTGGVVGPSSSTIGHCAVWNNTTGTLLSDTPCGAGGSGFPITLGSTGIAGSSTTSTISGLTLTAPTINGGALSGTLSGSPSFGGVPLFTGLSVGTQVSCLGLTSGNALALSSAACGAGGGLPSLTNGQILANATGSTAIAQATGLIAGSGITITAAGGNFTIGASGSGGVSGPGSSVNGDLSCWNGTSGNALSDCGIAGVNVVQSSRTIATTSPLTGGGNLSSNLNLGITIPTASLLGGSGGNFSSVAIGSGLDLIGGTLNALNTGTVTSVGLTMPTIFSVTGTPVTAAGSFNVSLVNQSANSAFLAPNGSAGAPAFRTLVNADLPTSGVTAGSYTNLNATVNAQGIITAAANGGGSGSGTVNNSSISGAATYYATTGTAVSANPLWLYDNNNDLVGNFNTSTSTPGFPTQLAHNGILAVGADGMNVGFIGTSYENGSTSIQPLFGLQTAGGTKASPTALGSNSQIGGLAFSGYNGSAFSNSTGVFSCLTSQAWTPSAEGTECTIGTTPNNTTTLSTAIVINNDGGMTVPPSVTGGDKGSGTINASGLFVNGVPVGTTQVVGYTGTTAGTANAQTIASPSPSGYTLTDQNVIHFKVGAGLANTAVSPTLNVNSTGAEPMDVQSGGALASLPIGYLQPALQYSATYQAGCTCYVVTTTPSSGITQATTSTSGTGASPTAAQFAFGQSINLNAASLTSTIPVSTTLSPGGGVVINAINAGTLTATSPDTITTAAGTTGAGGSITLAAGTVTFVTTDGAGHLYAAGNTVIPPIPASISWAPGQNLAGATNGIGLFTAQYARSVIAISCRPDTAVGGTATIDVWIAPSGTALGSGTKVTTTSCNSNGTAATNQTGLASSAVAVPIGDTIGIVASGAGWSSSVGAGSLTVSVQ